MASRRWRRGRQGSAALSGILTVTVLLAACQSPVTISITTATSEPASQVPTRIDAATPGTARQDGRLPLASTARQLTSDGRFAVLRREPPIGLSIPSIGLDTTVQEVPSAIVNGEWIWPVPPTVAGHQLGSANPGEPGNIVISGHVETDHGAGVFVQLPQVKAGDMVILRTVSAEFRYQVEAVSVIPGDDTSPLLQVPDEQLTLITCMPDGVYATRLILKARAI